MALARAADFDDLEMKVKKLIRMLVLDQKNELIAETNHPDTALLCVDRAWAEGDHVEIASDPGSHLMVQMDVTLPEGEIYLPDGISSNELHIIMLQTAVIFTGLLIYIVIMRKKADCGK